MPNITIRNVDGCHGSFRAGTCEGTHALLPTGAVDTLISLGLLTEDERNTCHVASGEGMGGAWIVDNEEGTPLYQVTFE